MRATVADWVSSTVSPPQETSSSFDLTLLVQYGVLGIVLILVLAGYLWAKPSVDRLIADKTRAEQQRDDLLDIYQTQVIPVLNQVQSQVVPGMAQVISGMEDLRRSVEALSQDLQRRSR